MVVACACEGRGVESRERERPIRRTSTPTSTWNTGASTGIGRHAAETLAQQGFVVFAGVRKEADGEAVKAANPDKIVPVILDVTKQEHVDAAKAAVQKELEARGNLPLVRCVGRPLRGCGRRRTVPLAGSISLIIVLCVD